VDDQRLSTPQVVRMRDCRALRVRKNSSGLAILGTAMPRIAATFDLPGNLISAGVDVVYEVLHPRHRLVDLARRSRAVRCADSSQPPQQTDILRSDRRDTFVE
jgi:hypothetical protein